MVSLCAVADRGTSVCDRGERKGQECRSSGLVVMVVWMDYSVSMNPIVSKA